MAELGTTGHQRTELLLGSSTGPEPGPCFFDSGRPSPDGTRIAAVDYCEGGLRIHTIGTGTTELLTDTDYYEGPAWSPDGRRILVAAGPTRTPRVFDVETGKS
ncbi:MAG: hypothetical protein GWN32_17640, partial [Gemmatimonadetes bacterium]|nr:hypothetical protein [Gemmatimonadota bacterium]